MRESRPKRAINHGRPAAIISSSFSPSSVERRQVFDALPPAVAQGIATREELRTLLYPQLEILLQQVPGLHQPMLTVELCELLVALVWEDVQRQSPLGLGRKVEFDNPPCGFVHTSRTVQTKVHVRGSDGNLEFHVRPSFEAVPGVGEQDRVPLAVTLQVADFHYPLVFHLEEVSEVGGETEFELDADLGVGVIVKRYLLSKHSKEAPPPNERGSGCRLTRCIGSVVSA